MRMTSRLKIFPQSVAARVRLGALLLILIAAGTVARVDRVAQALATEKHEGDVVFQSLPRGPLVDAIEGVTRSPWSHCGILMQRDGKWYVVEALGDVCWTPYFQWIVRGRGSRVEVYRPASLNAEGTEALRRELISLTGRPYDFRYAPGDDEIYCSELVYLAYERATGLRLAEWERLGDLNWGPHESFIREMEAGPAPLDRRMITPVALTRSRCLVPVLPRTPLLPSTASIPPG
jgi:hypothetical protein